MYTQGKTPTIRKYLLSIKKDEHGRLNGYETNLDDVYGDFLSYEEIIDSTYEEFFKRIYLTVEVNDRFKKDFCNRFYNKNIGYETFDKFFNRVSDVLNTRCYNYLKMLEKVRDLEPDKGLETTDMTTKSNYKNRNKGLGMVETRPDKYKEITYTQDYDDVTISYANDLSENRGNGEGENESNTKGKNTRPIYQELNDMAHMEDLQNIVFDIVEDICFQTVG